MEPTQTNRAGTRHCGREWPDGGLKVLHLLMGLDIGGVERLLVDALPLFPDTYRVGVLALGADGPIGDLLRKGGVPVNTFGGSTSHPEFIFKLYKYLREKKPGILHTHLYWPGMLGRIMGRFAGVDTIICHEHFPSEELSAWRRRLERPTWKYADAVVAVSEAVGESRFKNLPPAVARFVVPNAIALDEVSSESRMEAREVMGATKENIVAGWVGRVDETTKNLSALLEAARRLNSDFPQIRWVLIGDGPDRAALEKRTQAMGLTNTVRWLGMQPRARRLYAGMDIFVLPSKFEGSPIVLPEAMAAGVPVVASRVGGIPEVVIDNESGILVERGNSEALAAGVARLAKDPGMRKVMGEKGRKRAVENFGIKTFVDNIDRVYRSVWAGKDSRCAGSPA